MGIGDRIKAARKRIGLTQRETAEKANISRSYFSDVENNRYNPSLSTLVNIADALNVSVDRLTGESASSIIEDRLKETDMTIAELSERSKVPVRFIENLDDIVPDHEVDGGEQCYSYVSAIAWILGIPGSKLRLAFARQEVPTDQMPDYVSDAREDFDIAEPVKPQHKQAIDTVAAHLEGKNVTPKKLKLIEQYIDALFEENKED